MNFLRTHILWLDKWVKAPTFHYQVMRIFLSIIFVSLTRIHFISNPTNKFPISMNLICLSIFIFRSMKLLLFSHLVSSNYLRKSLWICSFKFKRNLIFFFHKKRVQHQDYVDNNM